MHPSTLLLPTNFAWHNDKKHIHNIKPERMNTVLLY